VIRLDFETYSEAGFVWDPAPRGWGALPGASKKGLAVVGAAAYVEHPTFEVLCLSYELGGGVRRWQPSDLPPVPLLSAIQRGELLSGWNSGGFEFKVWNKYCVPKWGWPPITIEQVRDTMACARAYALPGALAKAAGVLGTLAQKNTEGKRLLDKFSIPRNPTKKDARLRITVQDDPVDAELLYAYCDQDVHTESEVATLIPELAGEELDNWMTDRRINDRGVQIDILGVETCISIIEQAHSKYNEELGILTGGAVSRASELARLRAWCAGRGVCADSLDEESIEALLKTNTLSGEVRRALEIRALVGSASVKKVFSMRNTVASDGRLHDLFIYHGARTGRCTGAGPQPTNLPNSAGATCFFCEGCARHYGTATGGECPYCGVSDALSVRVDWCVEAAEDALRAIHTCSLGYVEHIWGDAMRAVSGCLRGLFIAAPGHDLICSDYSAIEAVVIAELAGEAWRQGVFRTHGKIYEQSAANISGVPFEDFMRHAGYSDEQLVNPAWWTEKPARKGSHHPLRKTLGKVAELACFSPDTQVLTKRGYVGIGAVQLTDKLWDGVEWVSHRGVISKGKRGVINLAGVRMTPTHPVSIGHSWREASELASNENLLDLALEIGSRNLPSGASNLGKVGASRIFLSRALAGVPPTPSPSATYARGGVPVATCARKLPPQKPGSNGVMKSLSGFMRRPSRMSRTVGDSLIALAPRYNDATISTLAVTQTMVEGGFGSSLHTGMTRVLIWIEKMLMGTTSRGISASSQGGKTLSTKGVSKSCSDESRTWSNVYDIAHAGPRNRFTIRTDHGHLVVHNSGYQGWVGSWKAFGADEFMTEQEMKDAILTWREASPAIVEFWGGQERNWKPELYGIEGAFVYATLNSGVEAWVRGIRIQRRGSIVFIRLLSGREMAYHNPVLSPSSRRAGTFSISFEGNNTNPKNGPPGWVRMETWGGRLVENIVQATARDIQWHGIRALESAGYPVVLHVYDEDISEVPEGFGSVHEFERIMSTMPPWAEGWPIRANGGWRGKRYRK
jgi:hypothetical protein